MCTLMRRAASRAASWMLRTIFRLGVQGQHFVFNGQVAQSAWLER